MLAIIGTYRGLTYVPRLLDSIDNHTSGITEIVFVNDSPNPVVAEQLLALGRGAVVNTHGQGYNAAMQAVVELGKAHGAHAAFLEEDFYFTKDVDFSVLVDHLDTHPYLSQVVLQRQAWFPVELRAGGMLRVFKNRGKVFKKVDGYLEHDFFFSCNPAVWNKETFKGGWPEVQWSENEQRFREILRGRKFAITDEVFVYHDGIRSGKDY